MRRSFKPSLDHLENRALPAPLPVLMVIANQDFYYQEYNDTRNSILADGVPVVVAATTTTPSTPHPGSGQGSGSGVVTPTVALGSANADNYSAIVFVGGWGSSMYQYAFNDPNFDGVNDNFYFNTAYNGMAAPKQTVNNLINEFLADDKPVAGVCHGVTVLAWARVNGVSPVSGKNIVVPHTDGTPGMVFNGTSYSGGYAQGQYLQAKANNAIVSSVGGQMGNPTTAADDVIVDGRIITAENQHSAALFGHVIAREVKKPTPIQGPASITIPEGTPGVLAQFTSTDPDGGPLTWSLQGPNANLFNISSTGVLSGKAELDGGTFTGGIRVAVADVGGDNAVKDIDIIVTNVAPTATGLDGPSILIAGEPGTFTLSGVSDIAADMPTMKHSHWKLGDVIITDYSQASSQLSATFTFSTPGTQTIQGRAFDKDGGISATQSRTVQVVAPPTVGSFIVNDGEAQRSSVTRFQQRFADVPPASYFQQPGAIRLVRNDGLVLQRHASGQNDFTVMVDVDATGDGVVTTTDFLSFPTSKRSLPDGRWHFEVPGINYSGPEFHRLYGDMDGNATVDASDFAIWSQRFGTSIPNAPEDWDGNNFLDAADLAAFGNHFGITL